MPRKVPSLTSPRLETQNRDAQRRSRARQRELVDELQLRLREHEQRGVEATLAMQRAARKVMRENQRLRALLQRLGVESVVVDGWVADEGEEGDGDGDCGGGGGGGGGGAVGERGGEKGCDLGEEGDGERERLDMEIREDRVRISYICNGVADPECCQPPEPGPGRECGTGLDVLAAVGVETSKASPSTLETPCDEAVGILAALHQGRRHVDTTQARAALGCNGERDCLVRNTRLFQVMDEIS
ncbi:hypothetical protein B0H67DRAFT_550936 [Lasiosphaeris hirsuta]|uniref:BZIP domain-containing protein n=1 Tax=Lasiosphaeris hirsuta TaxID=260670 RepID=A0AA40E625_9PEZI|nr:hypothetical protein B0H67DRAFT_550936 [Lasiosphaeris hirsuta]